MLTAREFRSGKLFRIEIEASPLFIRPRNEAGKTGEASPMFPLLALACRTTVS